MKLVRVHRADDLETKIKHKFLEFNRTSLPSKGRKYPDDLKALVCRALAEGIRPIVLLRLTGVSASAMHKWTRTANASVPSGDDAKASVAPRRLEVFDCSPVYGGAIVVRFPSGVSIEFGDAAGLNHEILKALATLEVNHAASS